MIYGYIRVSSERQTVESQRFEIVNFCSKHNLQIIEWIEETVSGTKEYNKRKLGLLLEKVDSKDTIICTEISRLGRSLFMVMEILSCCLNKGCSVWTIKDNFRLGDDVQSKILAFAFSISAEIERNLISQRTREALKLKRTQGVSLGRPFGSKTAWERRKLYPKHILIIELLKTDCSKRQIADICKVTPNTLLRYIRDFIT